MKTHSNMENGEHNPDILEEGEVEQTYHQQHTSNPDAMMQTPCRKIKNEE